MSRHRDSEDGQRRDRFISTRMTENEVARMDQNRGSESRSTYLRRLAAQDKRSSK